MKQTNKRAAEYRAIAFKGRPNNCKECGCTKHSLLEVHHIDENRNNNVLENLEIYCHTCHLKLHKIVEKRNSRSQRGSNGKLAKGTRRKK